MSNRGESQLSDLINLSSIFLCSRVNVIFTWKNVYPQKLLTEKYKQTNTNRIDAQSHAVQKILDLKTTILIAQQTDGY